MILFRTLLFLVLAGLKNRAKAQLKRLRQPRYLFFTSLGLGYWWWFWGKGVMGFSTAGGKALAGDSLLGVELAFTGFGLLTIAVSWIWGSERAAISFSEAEIQYLFPAPFTRRQLLHYKLLRSLLAGLVGALLTTLIFGRGLSGHPFFFAIGSWISFSTLSLHSVASSFTRSSLAEHGLSGLRRKLLTVAVVGAFGALLWWSISSVVPPGDFEPTLDYARSWLAAIDAPPLSLVILPARAPVMVALARTPAAFLEALPAALLVLFLHYVWVMASSVQFEEGTLEAAQKRAKWLERRRSGRGAAFRPPEARKAPFALAATGRPEVALVWKGMIAGGRLITRRRLIYAALLLAALAGAHYLGNGHFAGFFSVLGPGAVFFYLSVILLGPTLARSDLRLDLPNLETLRSLPLLGRQIVLAEILSPAASLALLQWLILPVAVLGLSELDVTAGPLELLALGLACAILGPALTLAALTIQNAVVVILPGWVQTGPERPRGPEAVGMRLVVLLGNLLALAFAVIPAGIVGGIVLLVCWDFAGLLAAPLAALAGAALICAEVWLAAAALGRLFDRLELTPL